MYFQSIRNCFLNFIYNNLTTLYYKHILFVKTNLKNLIKIEI